MPRPVHAWADQPIHFIDFEGARACGVLEYGVVTLQGGGIGPVHTRLCAPTGEIPAGDIAVHGLGPRQLAGCRPFSAEFELFAGLRQTGPLAAHYAGVENALLKAAWAYPRPSEDFARPGARIADWGPWIDSAVLAAHARPGLASQRLEAVVAALGLQETLDGLAATHCPAARRHYHAAPYDALASAVIVRALVAEPPLAGLTLSRLLVLSTRNAGRREAMVQRDLFG